MGLSKESVFAGFTKSASRHELVFEAERMREALFAPYASVAALLAALRASSPLGRKERDSVVVALVGAQQRATHPLWPALLLAAFEPALRRLCRRANELDEDEAIQRVALAFLEAVGKISSDHPPAHVALYLTRATARVLFGGLRAERRAPETVPFVEATHGVIELEEHDDRITGSSDMILAEPNGEELLDAMLASVDGSTLAHHVRTVHSQLGEAAQRAIYRRLQRQQHRVAARLRRRLAPRRTASETTRAA